MTTTVMGDIASIDDLRSLTELDFSRRRWIGRLLTEYISLQALRILPVLSKHVLVHSLIGPHSGKCPYPTESTSSRSSNGGHLLKYFLESGIRFLSSVLRFD
ncbi:hypothetical protein K443DRAFT_686335 [Laccaria amethystina LaAM-08-1]|uniref:Uncharacterized protein n=1 Tax=Laccaria amethystina LaAM-08-1 TaxID=1095629 RepID=A0A0C9WHD2_9AGAR|nr:hypothetical protein K443DRAFT_686335 [Laccaria amethystina LaAM-08-1]